MNCDVVQLPPTPHKDEYRSLEDNPQKENSNNNAQQGISTQILPLSRLSSGNSPPISSQQAAKSAADSSTPVKGTLTKLRKTLAEPLLQYFHDLQVSPPNNCDEEPEVLNTPKSVQQQQGENRVPRVPQSGKARNLFKTNNNNKGDEGEKAALDRTYANMPPITITDM